MKVLVTGVAGFIGSALARSLALEGHDIVGVDCLTDYYDRALKLKNLLSLRLHRLIVEDLNCMDLDSVMSDVDIVFHQAGQPGVRNCWGAEFDSYTARNITATQRLLEAARRAPRLRRFVYASSSSVYGNAPSYPTLESTATNPLSPYGVTKLAAEHLCSLYAANFGVPTVSLRYFTVYGPGQRPDMAFRRFCAAALTQQPLIVFGNGEQVRDFTYVTDVVRANIMAGFTDGCPGRIYNVAGGTRISVNEILRIFEGMSRCALTVDRRDAVAGDVAFTGGSTDLIHRELGWRPEVSIDDGLSEQFAWASAALGKVYVPAA